MEKNIPNLFLVGSMKSGTTTLHNYLDEHPEIFMSQKPWKETRYFVKEMNWQKGQDWYLSLYQSAEDSEYKYRGESSTDYTKLPYYQGIPERIASFNPNSYIIYIMRDPIERSISHYWWEVRFSGEGRDMLTSIQKIPQITNVSYYAMQIRPYLNIFGRERVFTLTLEELSNDTLGTLKKIFSWLEIDSSFVPESIGRKDNVQLERILKMRGSSVFSHLRGTIIWEWMKKIISSSARKNIMNLMSHPVEKDLSLVPQTIEYLRPIQQKQTEKLCQLLNRNFPEWQTLYGKDLIE